MNSFHKIVAKAIEANRSPEETSLQETEEKFSSLVLAFKTDRETLDKRKELHLRARDIAEQNIQKELEGLKEGMKTLNQICNNSPSQQTLSKVQHHVEVLEQSVARMSSQAEVHGAVQQELRVSRAIDVMVRHVENLKKVYEKEHAELLEARKTLSAGRRDSRESLGDVSRSTNLPGLPQFRASRRRASIAVISKNPLQLRSSIASSKLVESNSSRLVHRNSALMSRNLSLDEADEDTDSTDNPRPLIRRKSSSLIEELPSSLVDQLQLTSGRDPSTSTSTSTSAEQEEDEEEEGGGGGGEKDNDEDDDRDTTRVNESEEDDSETESLAMYFEKRKPHVLRESIRTLTSRLSSILENGISFGQRLIRKLSQMSTKLGRVNLCARSMSRYASRAQLEFQGVNCRSVAFVTLLLTALVVLSIGVWMGWIPLVTLYGIFNRK